MTETDKGHVTLEQLTRVRPPKADVEIGGLKFQLRAMTSGQVQHIVRATRDPSAPTGYDLEMDRTN